MCCVCVSSFPPPLHCGLLGSGSCNRHLPFSLWPPPPPPPPPPSSEIETGSRERRARKRMRRERRRTKKNYFLQAALLFTDVIDRAWRTRSKCMHKLIFVLRFMVSLFSSFGPFFSLSLIRSSSDVSSCSSTHPHTHTPRHAKSQFGTQTLSALHRH